MDQEVIVALAYGLTSAVAMCIGILYAYTARLPHRRIPVGALGVLVLVFVAVAFAIGSQVPWMGPIFALIVVISSMLTRGALLRDHPLIGGDSYWRRVLWGTSRAPEIVATEAETSASAPVR